MCFVMSPNSNQFIFESWLTVHKDSMDNPKKHNASGLGYRCA